MTAVGALSIAWLAGGYFALTWRGKPKNETHEVVRAMVFRPEAKAVEPLNDQIANILALEPKRSVPGERQTAPVVHIVKTKRVATQR